MIHFKSLSYRPVKFALISHKTWFDYTQNLLWLHTKLALITHGSIAVWALVTTSHHKCLKHQKESIYKHANYWLKFHIDLFQCVIPELGAEQCYTSTGGVYSAGSIYRNLKYCAFGCCGPALNRYCCPIIGPIVGICVGAIAFIVILIVIIVCCRKYSERQIRRRAEMKTHLGKDIYYLNT